MLKKIVIALFAAAMLAVPLVGCGEKPTATIEESEKDYVVVKMSEDTDIRYSFEYRKVYENYISDLYGVTGQNGKVISVGILADGSGSIVWSTDYDDLFVYTEKILPNNPTSGLSYTSKLDEENAISFEAFLELI